MNCKKEFLEETNGRSILCAQLGKNRNWDTKYGKVYNLPIGFTTYTYNKFLKSLDFEYDDGYGGQEIFGYIWYQDGTWSEREKYDGSEWWSYKSVSVIPNELKGATK